MKIPRVFIPLAKTPYLWFSEGNKKWELRKYGRQYTERNIKTNRIVELRCGYSNKDKAIWGVITQVVIFDSLLDVYKDIYFKEIIPDASNEEEAIERSRNILKIDIGNTEKFIVFKIKNIKNPQFIEFEDRFIELIKEGTKETTIRKGSRDYKKGICIAYGQKNSILINIIKIDIKPYHDLNADDALNDGFNSLSDLKNTLEDIYGEVTQNQIMTVVHFHNFEGDYSNAY